MIAFAKEILSRRDLIRELVIKDLKTRYCRPVLGFLWAFLSPLLLVLTYYVVFSLFLKVKTVEAPFVLYLMSGVFQWNLFQGAVMSSVTSLVDNKALIKEARFPQYLIPFSIVIANGINFLPMLAVLIIASVIYLKTLPVFIFLLPLILIVHLITALGVSMIAAVLYIRIRDTRYVLEVFLLVIFYLIPVFYPLSLVKDYLSPPWFAIYICNPFVGILSLYRVSCWHGFYPLIRNYLGITHLMIIPVCFSVFILWIGYLYYKRNENTINDRLSY